MGNAVTTKARRQFVRGTFIVFALVSLCVSDGVGPRLMPLPVPEVAAAAAGERQGADPEASRSPSHSKGSSRWVELAAAPQKNSDYTRREQAQSATHAPQSAFEAPAREVLFIWDAYGPLYTFTTSVLRPPGRAPPRLV